MIPHTVDVLTALALFHLTALQYQVLRTLSREDIAVPEHVLEVNLNVDRPSLLTAIVDLQDRGMLERHPVILSSAAISITQFGLTMLGIAQGFLRRKHPTLDN